MPIYPYQCTVCGHTEEILTGIGARNREQFCPHCGTLMRRALEQQTIQVRGDIEPGFDESLGEYVGSRRELREKLAYHNAYCPDLMLNSEPLDGRLHPSERAIIEGREPIEKKSIFERRREPGWENKFSAADVLGSNDPSAADGIIEVEGKADYKEITDYIKERSTNAQRTR